MPGGGGSPSQAVVQTGPAPWAANAAAQAQITAANAAAQAATQNTNSAIKALMNEYQTGLTYAQPTINTGNQAGAQLNYMLGLNAVAPGTEPTSPTSPTLASVEAGITPEQVNQYVQENIAPSGASPLGQNFAQWQYTGIGATDPGMNAREMPGIGPTSSTPMQSWGDHGQANSAPDVAMIRSYLAQNELNNPNSSTNTNYQQALQAYKNQNDQWTKQNDVYNYYKGKGTASAADIGAVVNNLPGMQFQQQQGIQGIQNAASASGMLNSGSLLQDLNKFGQGLSSTYYNNYLGQLSNLAGMGTAGTQSVMGSSNQLGSNIAGMQSQLGNTIANSQLAAGQAMASSYLAPLSSQQTRVTNIGGGGGGSGLGGAMGMLGSLFGGGGGGGGLLGGLF